MDKFTTIVAVSSVIKGTIGAEVKHKDPLTVDEDGRFIPAIPPAPILGYADAAGKKGDVICVYIPGDFKKEEPPVDVDDCRYIRSCNRALINAAMEVLRGILPSENYGVIEADLQEINRKLRAAWEKTGVKLWPDAEELDMFFTDQENEKKNRERKLAEAVMRVEKDRLKASVMSCVCGQTYRKNHSPDCPVTIAEEVLNA